MSMKAESVIEAGMAACSKSTTSEPGRYVAKNVCMMPARQSRKPMTANGFFETRSFFDVRLSYFEVRGLVRRRFLGFLGGGKDSTGSSKPSPALGFIAALVDEAFDLRACVSSSISS